MIFAAKIFYILFGLLTIAGGVMGYAKAQSLISLVAGALTGILLVIAGLLLPGRQVAGLVLGAVVSLVLAAQFVPKFINTMQWMPAGLMSIFCAVSLLITLGAAFSK